MQSLHQINHDQNFPYFSTCGKADMYNIWNHYNQVRLKGDKKSANKLLTDFIVLYKKQERQAQKDFVDEICTQILDKDSTIFHGHYCLFDNGVYVSNAPIRIQFPLFKEVILPELLERYKNNDPKAIRWLGQLEMFLHRNRNLQEQIRCELETNDTGARYFFEKSYELEKNQRTLDLLLKNLFYYLEYDCHEIPCGVLEEPEIINSDVAKLRRYWEQWEKKNEDKRVSWLLEYEAIAHHWETYYKNSKQYCDFMDYLIQNFVTTIEWRNSRSCPLPNDNG